MPRINAKKIALFLWRHKGAVAKLLLVLMVISIILFLPVRSEIVVSSITWDTSKSVSIRNDVQGNGYSFNFTDVATVVNGTVQLSISTDLQSLCSPWCTGTYVPLNITCYDFARYGAKLHVRFGDVELGGVPDGQSSLSLGFGVYCGGGHWIRKVKHDYSTRVGQTTYNVSGVEFDVSYLDVLEEFGKTLSNVPNTTMYVYVYGSYNSISATISVSGGATVRKPVYTAFTEPVMSAISAVWGAIVAAVRRARSVLNSAIGGFFGFFGISAFTGSALLSLAIVMVVLWFIHHRRKR